MEPAPDVEVITSSRNDAERKRIGTGGKGIKKKKMPRRKKEKGLTATCTLKACRDQRSKTVRIGQTGVLLTGEREERSGNDAGGIEGSGKFRT